MEVDHDDIIEAVIDTLRDFDINSDEARIIALGVLDHLDMSQ